MGGQHVKQLPIAAESISPPDVPTILPAPLASRVAGRTKRKLGDHFGLTNFGVNLTQLAPGSASALLHRHSSQDEFIYVLQGKPTLRLNDEEHLLNPGDCMGFKAGSGVAHQLINRSKELVIYIEIGDRSADDEVDYPEDDLKAVFASGGVWKFTHKDGSAY
jgi:uncharacterized cupin superfamily protein